VEPLARRAISAAACAALSLVLAACTPAPPRTSFARYAGAPDARDPAASDPQAIAIADRVFAAAGGAHWADARELRWTQTLVDPAARPAAGPAAPDDTPPPRRMFSLEVQHGAGEARDHRWDRWNGRYAVWAHQTDLDAAVVIDLYAGDSKVVAQTGRGVALRGRMIAEHDGGARATWNVDTALLCLPFLLAEPDARLVRLPAMFGENGELSRIGVTFGDPLRAGTAFELELAGDVIARVVVRSAASPGPVVYALGDRVVAGGLAIPTTWTELASGRRTQITGLAVRAAVDDNDFVRP
jgi:hypothetical protein